MSRRKGSRKPKHAVPTGGLNMQVLADVMASLNIGSTSSPSKGSVSVTSEQSSRYQVLHDFFTSSGSFAGDSRIESRIDRRAAKLALWQAILLTTGVCSGASVLGSSRPAHFPEVPLPVPTSVTACRKLIKEYLFINIVNFKKSQIGHEPLILFSSVQEVATYTRDNKRYANLAKAKADLLNPLLRMFFYRGGRLHFREDAGDEDETDDEDAVGW